MIRLGPFELTRVIGAGGMGTIWHARHLKQDVEVAIKVIQTGSITSEQNRLFRREAMAMAMLNHRAIIGVHDFGLLSSEAALASGGELTEGSPYLVMDLASGGSLCDRPRPRNWRVLKSILLQVLEGLAHAHAHDLIHRDLKPGNVLVMEVDGRREVKLTDFGIAYVGTTTEFSAELEMTFSSAGTPAYMAPEQIQGMWREVGPWTDLYSLGCMAYELASGAPPFEAATANRVLMAHLAESPTPLRPDLAVPPGFWPWIERLLQKRAGDRFVCAADAAWALANLDVDWQPPEDPRITVMLALDDGLEGSFTNLYTDPTRLLPTLVHQMGNTQLADTKQREPVLAPVPTEDVMPTTVRLATHAAPAGLKPIAVAPFPLGWGGALREQPTLLLGVGLGLFGARSIGLVGRIEERDRIWAALKEVRTDGRAQAIVLRGASGSGKSAIAEWVARRAVELGAATLLQATFSDEAGPGEGLPSMLTRFFRAEMLEPDKLTSHVAERIGRLGPDAAFTINASALAEIMTAPSAPGAWQHMLPLLRGLARRRPLILWLDDVHWSSEALDFACALLQRDLPVLCLLTVRDEVLAERPSEQDLVRRIGDAQGGQVISIPPLSDQFQYQLIRRLLPLGPDFCQQLVQRTSGNPHYAVELLGDWNERGLLTPEKGHFRPPPGILTQLPESLHQVWAERVERVLATCGEHKESVRRAMELAACFGRFVRRDEWEAACKAAGLEVTPDIIDVLGQARLLRGDGVIGSFTHEALRETILQLAEEAGRLQEHHLVCLDVVQAFNDLHDLATRERQCRHLLGAGLNEHAFERLVELAKTHTHSLNNRHAIYCAMLAEQALGALDVAADDSKRIALWVVMGWNQFHMNLELAEEYAARIEEHAGLPRDAKALGDTARLRAGIANVRGETTQAEAHHHRALKYYQVIDDQSGAARVHLALGHLRRLAGSDEQARDHVLQAVEAFRNQDDVNRLCAAMIYLGQLLAEAGELDAAEESLSEAMSYAARAGEKYIVLVRGAMADVFRYRGDFKGAAALYRECLDFESERDGWGTNTHAVNLALMLNMLGHFDEAASLCNQTIANAKVHNHSILLGLTYLLATVSAAGTGNHGLWQECFSLAEQHLAVEESMERDIAVVAEEAARLARRHGWTAEARRALMLAVPVLEGLGDEEALARVEGLLRTSQA